MDKSVISGHLAIISKHYPNLNISQLGLVLVFLASLRASMGHEGARGTVLSYIHKKQLSPDIKMCVDFLEREVLRLKKSKIDIGYWKFGKTGSFRRDRDLKEVSI